MFDKTLARWSSSKNPGICWDCRRVAISSLHLFPRYTTPTVYTAERRAIRKNCPLCAQLETLFDTRLPIEEADPAVYKLQDKIELQTARLDASATRDSLYFVLQSVVYSEVCREICIIPKHLALASNPTFADLGKAKYWLDECRSSHIEPHNTRNWNGKHALKVTDCATRQICLISEESLYICLSYVWGAQSAAAQSLTIELQQPPKTIEDAMFVALTLGIPYLWVDRYCIGPDDKHHLIRNMDKIYQGATLTIIAAAGTGPWDGLPGVRGTSRRLLPDVINERNEWHTLKGELRGLKPIENPKFEIIRSKWYKRLTPILNV